jgi:hypothetical protein
MAITIQPINTYVAMDDGECKVIYLQRASNTFQAVQQLFPNQKIVLEIFIEGSTCIMTVNHKTNVLAFTTFNLKTLRVAPTGCPLDQLNMAMVKEDLYSM